MSAEYKRHTISLYVANKPGVLIRTALVFARRGYNIDSLVVSEAHDPAYSQMNIVASGDTKTLDQILKQLNKLVDVIHAKDNTDETTIQKELALLKVKCNDTNRSELIQIITAYKGNVVDLSETTMVFQVSGSSEKLDAVHRLCDHYGVLEMIRSGKLLMARGESIT
ncbi:MAG: acetolactate synthase small subunit [Spirochaetales bacterium]|nr:acetolactate synthase small subunit [Spirochaetales bacterium]